MFRQNATGRVSPRSEVANQLLRLAEAATNSEARDAILAMESMVLSSPAGPVKHDAKKQLDSLLADAPRVMAGRTPSQALDYLAMVQEAIMTWQTAKEEDGGRRMGLLDWLSPKAREQKKDEEKIAALRRDLSFLRQRQHTLTADVEKAENERAALLERAKNEAPGSNAFRMAKVRYDELGKQARQTMFQFNAFATIIETKSNYLSALESKQTARSVRGLMPDKPETMQRDMDIAVMDAQDLVDSLNNAAEGNREAAGELSEVFDQLAPESESDFEATIRQMQKADAILGPSVQSSVNENASVPEIPQSENAAPATLQKPEEDR